MSRFDRGWFSNGLLKDKNGVQMKNPPRLGGRGGLETKQKDQTLMFERYLTVPQSHVYRKIQLAFLIKKNPLGASTRLGDKIVTFKKKV